MRAWTRDRYGLPDVLRLTDVEQPVPKDDEVLVRVHCTTINIGDWLMLTGTPRLARLGFGLFRPKRRILGSDVAGVVESAGTAVTRFAPGDEVMGETDGGTFAEFAVAPEERLVRKPANVSFEQAAAAPLVGCTALRGLRTCGAIREGHRVLINGASGGVGTTAVQVAKAFGAEVTGVCSTRNLEMVRSIGADHVSDYTHEDFTQLGRRWDLLFDLVGNRPLPACRRVLTPDGIYLSSMASLGRIFNVLLTARFVRRRQVLVPPDPTQADLLTVAELLESGKLKPVIDQRWTLEQIPDAMRHQGEGHTQGKSVVRLRAEE